MQWNKQGRIYVPDGSQEWAVAYAFPASPILLDDDTIRIFCAFCDANTVGRPAYVDVDARDPSRVLSVSQQPLMDIGRPGAFDDNGVVPTCVTRVGERLYMPYAGFQLGHHVRYFQFLGLAVSDDNGETFTRCSQVPILERSNAELVNRTSGFLRHDGERFQLWYVGGSEWTTVDGKTLPVYSMRYLESTDPLTWAEQGELAFELDAPDEHAVGRPWVERADDGSYRMFYSSRRRTNGYRIGYAESPDGREWTRLDDTVQLATSDEGWDSEMVAYASVITVHGVTYMFYNGNECGKTGLGYAILEGA
jgi:hypothetical protein